MRTLLIVSAVLSMTLPNFPLQQRRPRRGRRLNPAIGYRFGGGRVFNISK